MAVPGEQLITGVFKVLYYATIAAKCMQAVMLQCKEHSGQVI